MAHIPATMNKHVEVICALEGMYKFVEQVAMVPSRVSTVGYQVSWVL